MKPLENVMISADWLGDARLQRVIEILTGEGAETLVAGGAVRNALMNEGVTDVDLCTTLLPDEVIQRCTAHKIKTVPTGIDHGTVTVVIDGSHFEVTTLREDVETDGRHAIVKFGTNWLRDAERRDLTINALYCNRDGQVFDPLDGYADIEKREVRFIGDPSQRIKEDALRILRFFRFFAFYGSGRPDAAGLKACAANRELVQSLSAERTWAELKKLLSAPDPGRALLWMRTTGVLGHVLPESEKWGIDAIPTLVRTENQQKWDVDPLRRLMAIVRPHVETVQGIGKRLSFSNKELERFEHWAESAAPKSDLSEIELAKQLYRGSQKGMCDAMQLEIVHLFGRDDENGAAKMRELLSFSENWKRPSMPIQGRDLQSAGMSGGPQMGKALKAIEEAWVDSDFTLTKDELLEKLPKAPNSPA